MYANATSQLRCRSGLRKGLPQGLVRTFRPSEAHQSVMYSMKNKFVGFVLPYVPSTLLTKRTDCDAGGSSPKGLMMGRLGNQVP